MALLASVTHGAAAYVHGARSRATASPAVRAAVPPFVAAKLVSFLIPVLAVWSTSNTPLHPSYQEIVGRFGLWDGVNYIGIAVHEYPSGPLDLTPGHSGHLWGFFPGLPLLIKAVTFVIPDPTSAGVLISTVAEFFALFYLARLVLLERGGDEQGARFACWALAFFPDAVFLSAVYTDGLFLAAAIATVYYIRRDQAARGYVAAAVSSAMRITGVWLVPAILVELLLRRPRRLALHIAGLAAVVAPVLAFFAYAWAQTGNFFAYITVQNSASYGNRVFAAPWAGLRRTLQIAFGSGSSSYNYWFLSDAIWGTLGLLALVYFVVNWRRYPPVAIVFSIGVWLMAASLTYWQAMMRYEIAFIPLYLAAVDLRRSRPQLAAVLLAVSAGWMAFQTAMFAQGRFIV